MFENQCVKQKFDVFPIFVYEKKYFRDFKKIKLYYNLCARAQMQIKHEVYYEN